MCKKIIFLLILIFIVINQLLSAQEGNMELSNVYNKLISTAERENWKLCFWDASEDGDTVIKVYDFKTKKTLVIYKFSVNALTDFLPPSISNSGDKVGFWLKENSGDTSLYIINTDGSNLNKIITVARGHLVLWYPDDTKIVFGGFLTKEDIEKGEGKIYTVDIRTKEVNITIDQFVDGVTNQSFSPDGQKILYGYKGNIMIYNFLTKKSIKIAKGDWCAWSPKGAWIAYLQDKKLNIVNPDTLKRYTLVNNKAITPPIYWLPNGEYIIYGIFAVPGAELGVPYVIRIEDRTVEAISETSWMLASWSK